MPQVSDCLLAVARPLLIAHEGKRLHVYPDSLGIPTIGVGLALSQIDADGHMQASRYAMQLCQRCGVDYGAVLAGTADLTDAQCDQILTLCVIDAVEDLGAIFPGFSTYTLNRQAALVDVRINLGGPRFCGFVGMIAACRAGNWMVARAELLDSKAARELPTRYKEDAELLANG